MTMFDDKEVASLIADGTEKFPPARRIQLRIPSASVAPAL